jgi:HlyD family secretion protein
MPQVLEQEPTANSTAETTTDIARALFGSAVSEPPKANRLNAGRKRWIYVCALAAVLTASAAIWRARAGTAAPPYGTARVTRGTVAKTISATGKVQALTTVQVGTQVSGRVSEIFVDFNSKVKKGQVIARVDPSQLQAQLTQTTANLTGAQASEQTAKSAVAAADASVEAAEANLARAESVLADATRTFERNKMLVSEGVAPRRDLETSEAAVAQASAQRQQAMAQANQARAQAQSARSQLNQARAQVAQATASVQLASVNLDNTIIRAPIDGTIVSRNVDVGQTVAASLQAPTLFLIANDLTRMQVLADIDEADVGQLAEGTPVTFTVDAYPSDTFTGRVSQVRLSPQILQNVVTYTAVIDVENPDLKLKPGMTASITATVEEQKNALKIPNAALRFAPADTERHRPQPGSGIVYRITGDTLEPVSIRVGLTDGVSTQILSGNLREGDRVAVAAAAANGANRSTRPASMPGMGAPRGVGRIR